MSKRLSYFRKKARDLQQKIKQTPINDATLLHYLSSKCTKQLLELIKIQLTNCGRPGTGRRYTDEQKSLCLAMYKQGPRSYRFKSKWCILPTKRTLGRYSADLIFKSGVDPKMFESIKNVVKDWPQKQKLCAVTFDEIALKEHLAYSQAQDKIEGFVEMNRRMKEPLFATHSLTFMVRGLASNYKQPVGHFYTKGIKAFELVELVQLMVGEVSTTGKIVLQMLNFPPKTITRGCALMTSKWKPEKVSKLGICEGRGGVAAYGEFCINFATSHSSRHI